MTVCVRPHDHVVGCVVSWKFKQLKLLLRIIHGLVHVCITALMHSWYVKMTLELLEVGTRAHVFAFVARKRTSKNIPYPYLCFLSSQISFTHLNYIKECKIHDISEKYLIRIMPNIHKVMQYV